MKRPPEVRQAMRRCALASLLLLFPISAFAQHQLPPAAGISEDEYRKLDLKIKKRSVEIETSKIWISALTISVPIVVALFALAGTIIAARRTLVANFTAKAAELALQGEGPPEVINRATLLAQLYKDLLPKNFVDRVKKLDTNRIGRIVTQAPWISELQKDVTALLAQHPAQRQQIISDYRSVFPDYDFLDKLARATLKPAESMPQPEE
jgi:hypothetical protein